MAGLFARVRAFAYHAAQRMKVLWHMRVGSSHMRVRDVVFAVVYVLLHILFFFGIQDQCLGDAIAGDDWQRQSRAVATTFGYMASANALLLMLPATRNSVLSLLLGLEFDEAILFHRWLGRWTLILLAAHGIPYFPIWFSEWEQFVACRTVLSKFHFALTSLAASLLLGISSIQYFRRAHFQFFYWSHFAFFVFYIAGALHSQQIFLRLAIAAMALYIADRLLRFMWGLWPRRVVLNEAKDGDVVRVVFRKSRFTSYEVGNYVFLNFPQVSLLEWHPFTLSSGPYDEHNECHIKALGDYTRKLLSRVGVAQAINERLWIRVDGPYGHFSLNHERYPGAWRAECDGARRRARVSPAVRGVQWSCSLAAAWALRRKLRASKQFTAFACRRCRASITRAAATSSTSILCGRRRQSKWRRGLPTSLTIAWRASPKTRPIRNCICTYT